MLTPVLLLLIAFVNLARSTQLPLATTGCKQSCVINYEKIDEDACIRGTLFAEATQIKPVEKTDPTCYKSCEETYSSMPNLILACTAGCDACQSSVKVITNIRPDMLPELFSNFPNNILTRIREFFVPRVFNTDISSLDNNLNMAHSDMDSDHEKRVVITRIRIFHNLPSENSNHDLALEPSQIKSFMNLKNMLFGDVAKPELTNANHKVERVYFTKLPSTFQKVTYFLRHAAYRPLLLALFALLILTMLLVLKLAIQSCRSRSRHNYQYSIVPNYVETVDVKLPCYDDVNKPEKQTNEKAPIEA